jgi:hypothetical protein
VSKPFTQKTVKSAGWSVAGSIGAGSIGAWLIGAGFIVTCLAVAAIAMLSFGNAGSHSFVAKASSPATSVNLAASPTMKPVVSPAINQQQTSRVRASLGALPLAFEANEGQSDPQVKYMARGNGYTLFLTGSDAVFAVHSRVPATSSTPTKFRTQAEPALDRNMDRSMARSAEKTAAIRMQFVDGNANAQIASGSELPGRINYYIGNDRSKWHESVKQYAAVDYRNVYPGVDVRYHGEQRQLEFDFIVSPDANAAPIDLGFNGTSKITTDAEGNLILSSAAGDVTLHKPVAYQEKNGQRQLVDAAFRTNGRNKVSFALGSYDHSRELVIDPALSYATYLGGSGDDEAYAIALNSSGDAYVTGATDSATFAGKSAGTANFNVFVTEFNPAAASLVYTSIFSGSGDCYGNAIAVDGSGSAYVGGGATSGFPVTSGVLQGTFGTGTEDGFILKVNGSGTLTYSTYLGSDSTSVVNAIAIDTASPPNAYVAGQTSSSDFPGTSSSTIQSAYGGDDDAFVSELNGTATELVYSTYLGGSSGDLATGIALDSSADAYVTGITVSPNFPTTTGVLQSSAPAATSNGFVAEINAGGSQLTYSTYLGGNASSEAYAIAVDSAGEAFVTGNTNSTNFPTLNAAQTSLGGSSATNVFVTKLNAGATALVWSTYYGGSATDTGTSIALDSFGDAYVTGQTTSSNYPVSNGFQSSLNGSSDAFVTEFANTGFVEYSSYLGGSGGENNVFGVGPGVIGAIAVDSSSNAYLAGNTSSNDFPVTTGVYQGTYGGGPADAFVAKVAAAPADFSVAVSPATVTVSSGSTSSAITVTVSSVNASFGQAVSLSCTNLPSTASCSFSPASVTPGTSAVTSSLTISTTSSSGELFVPGSNGRMRAMAAIFMPLFGIVAIGGGINPRRKRLLGMFVLVILLVGLMLLPACGGGSSSGGGGGGGGGGTGTYNLTVSGASGSTSHAAPLTLTVN